MGSDEPVICGSKNSSILGTAGEHFLGGPSLCPCLGELVFATLILFALVVTLENVIILCKSVVELYLKGFVCGFHPDHSDSLIAMIG